MFKLIITIDGPAAVGKGTAASLIAEKYHLLDIDSGAMYRAAAWLALEHHVTIDQAHEGDILELLNHYPIHLQSNQSATGPRVVMKVGRIDITNQIRSEEISKVVSTIGQMLKVREQVKALQRRLAEQSLHGVVAEGRDTGTVVFPEADIKFFLTATPEIRAERRHQQLARHGEFESYTQVLADLQQRDRRDTERAYSALRIPADAVMIDSTDLMIGQVIETMSQSIDELKAKDER